MTASILSFVITIIIFVFFPSFSKQLKVNEPNKEVNSKSLQSHHSSPTLPQHPSLIPPLDPFAFKLQSLQPPIMPPSPTCPALCLSCSRSNGCTSCQPGHHLHFKWTGMRQIATCVATCPRGFYAKFWKWKIRKKETFYDQYHHLHLRHHHLKSSQCSKCPDDYCEACTSPHNCLHCLYPSFLLDGLCVLSCPIRSHLVDDVSRKCKPIKIKKRLSGCEYTTWSQWSPCVVYKRTQADTNEKGGSGGNGGSGGDGGGGVDSDKNSSSDSNIDGKSSISNSSSSGVATDDCSEDDVERNEVMKEEGACLHLQARKRVRLTHQYQQHRPQQQQIHQQTQQQKKQQQNLKHYHLEHQLSKHHKKKPTQQQHPHHQQQQDPSQHSQLPQQRSAYQHQQQLFRQKYYQHQHHTDVNNPHSSSKHLRYKKHLGRFDSEIKILSSEFHRGEKLFRKRIFQKKENSDVNRDKSENSKNNYYVNNVHSKNDVERKSINEKRTLKKMKTRTIKVYRSKNKRLRVLKMKKTKTNKNKKSNTLKKKSSKDHKNKRKRGVRKTPKGCPVKELQYRICHPVPTNPKHVHFI